MPADEAMRVPELPSLTFLAVVLILVPWGAWRTARRLRGDLPGPAIDRVTYWRSGVTLQVVLFVLAWLTGSSFGFRIFEMGPVDGADLLASLVALGLCFLLRMVSRWTRSEEELRSLSVYQRAPRTGTEVAWFSVAVVAASVAEEAVYRGVGWSILSYSFGGPWIAAVILSVAFSLAHWNQGWKAGVTIFGIAAVLHGLVAVTDTLVLAMGVHAVYDFIVGDQIRRRAREYDEAAAAS